MRLPLHLIPAEWNSSGRSWGKAKTINDKKSSNLSTASEAGTFASSFLLNKGIENVQFTSLAGLKGQGEHSEKQKQEFEELRHRIAGKPNSHPVLQGRIQ